MRGIRGSWSLVLAAVAAAELTYIPLGRAQEAPPPAAPEGQVQGGDVAPPPPGQPPGPPPPFVQPPAGPFVTLRASNPKARLQVQTQLTWQDVCLAPCNRPVNPAAVYRIGGGSIRASEPFNMPRASGQVVIDAEVGSKVKHWVGIGMIIVGALDMLGGTLYYALAQDLADTANSSTMDKSYFQAVGIVGIVTGVVLLAIGIPFSMSSTSVTIR